MTQEKPIRAAPGWGMLPVNVGLFLAGIAMFVAGFAIHPAVVVFGIVSGIVGFVLLYGHFWLQPNEACVLSFFGPYIGTVRESGFYWVNPFYSRNKISLRVRNFEGTKLKVNDKQGNPIEIAAVIIWRVSDTAQAVFDVDDYTNYVKLQSEIAIRHLANIYAYDHGEEHEITLRSGVDEVSAALKRELQDRLHTAGLTVDDVRLTHLAYAPEIANVMLRRQQAEAVIAARQKIVHGAVSMVQMALSELSEKQVVSLDDDHKARMVSNLLVVLCSEVVAQPVVNTGASEG
jgi:regulator of protease activity HflC (stomatin/prohibitin superfamily)